MNESGVSLQKVSSYYKIPPEEIVLVYDEINLDVGEVKISSWWPRRSQRIERYHRSTETHLHASTNRYRPKDSQRDRSSGLCAGKIQRRG